MDIEYLKNYTDDELKEFRKQINEELALRRKNKPIINDPIRSKRRRVFYFNDLELADEFNSRYKDSSIPFTKKKLDIYKYEHCLRYGYKVNIIGCFSTEIFCDICSRYEIKPITYTSFSGKERRRGNQYEVIASL